MCVCVCVLGGGGEGVPITYRASDFQLDENRQLMAAGHTGRQDDGERRTPRRGGRAKSTAPRVKQESARQTEKSGKGGEIKGAAVNED